MKKDYFSIHQISSKEYQTLVAMVTTGSVANGRDKKSGAFYQET